ncbi:DNA-directed RNA polymerase subunit H [Candidatus Woesearchaeota archaeon]|nr:DNA-directed RNA polymerase subunit H [Candidatus Woesearchaeota archaeon]
MTKKVDVKKHVLVPKGQKLGEKEKEDLLQKYGISVSELPRIKKSDPMLGGMAARPGEVIKINRSSPTAGKTVFYRVVVSG